MWNTVVILFAATYLVGAQDYLCPKEKDCDVQPCKKKALDLVFLIDGSESVENADFNISLRWLINTTNKFYSMNRTDGLRVFVIQYSENARLEVDVYITNTRSFEIFEEEVKSISQMASATFTYAALNYVNDEITQNTRNGAFKMLIAMTDGASLDTDASYGAIDTAKKNYDVIFAIGIGNNIRSDFRNFAHRSEPEYVADYPSLRNDTIIERIKNASLKGCFDLLAWCGNATGSTLSVHYCICPGLPDFNTSVIKNYQVAISPNGALEPTSTKELYVTTASFDGLSAATEYMITVTAITEERNATAISYSVNCSTKSYIAIEPMCGNSNGTNLNFSYSLSGNYSGNIYSHIEDFVIEISPHGTEVNSLIKGSNERSASFSGLSPNTTYLICITARLVDEADTILLETKCFNCSTCDIFCKEKPINLVFLIDGSESISSEDFNRSLNFSVNTIDQLNPVNRKDGVHVTVVQYSEKTEIELPRTKVEKSANEITGSVSAIQQIRFGTKPYTALKEVNEKIFLNSTSYNVLIMFSDGNLGGEVRNEAEINKINKAYAVKIVVKIGTDPDFNIAKDFNHNVPLGSVQLPENITSDIQNASHTDCIKLKAKCNCENNTATTLKVDYSYELYGSLQTAANVTTGYLVTIKSADGKELNDIMKSLDDMSALFTGLSPNTSYSVTVDGIRKNGSCGAVQPSTVSCFTKGIIKPDVICDSRTDTSVTVKLDPATGDSIQSYEVKISPSGSGPNPVVTKSGENTASFTGLTPSTFYNINATSNAPDVCALIESQSVDCSTKARITLKVECLTSTSASITVRFSGASTHPDGINSRITGYRLEISPGVGVQFLNVGATTATFTELTPSSNYVISVGVGLRSGVDDIVETDSVTCPTKGLIKLNLKCKNKTDNSLMVEYSINPNLPAMIEQYQVSISPTGSGQNVITKNRNDEMVASFLGLSHSTSYTVTISADPTGNEYEVEPVSVTCTTEEEVCEDKPIHLVILLDGSESISEDQFNEGLNWISSVINLFKPTGRTENLRAIVIQFSESVQSEHDQDMKPSEDSNFDVGKITQLRSGTHTYEAVRFVNSDITPAADSLKVLIMMTDGDATDLKDMAAVNTIRMNHDVMIAVRYGGTTVSGTDLQDFSTVGMPITMEDSSRPTLNAIVKQTLEASCRKESMARVDIVVFCETTTNTMTVRYYPVPVGYGTNSSLIENYAVSITPSEAGVNSVVNSISQTTFTGLSASTEYMITVSGNIVNGAKIEVNPTVATCTTKDPCSPSPCKNGGNCTRKGASGYTCNCPTGWTEDHCEKPDIIPTVECVITSETVVVVSYSVIPTERGYDSSLIRGYSVGISPSSGNTTLVKSVGDMTAMFIGLTPSTGYTVTVTAIKVTGADVEVSSRSTTCRTKVTIRPNVTCASGMKNSLTVTYNIPGVSDSSLIQSYTVGNSNVNKTSGDNTASFSGLSECTEYTITVDANVDPSKSGDVILEQGSTVCRTGEGPVAPTFEINTSNPNELRITINELSCVTNYTIIYTRFDCNSSSTEIQNVTGTTHIIPRQNDGKYSVTVSANYPVSGMIKGTSQSVPALSGGDCSCTSLPTSAPVSQAQNDCQSPIIALGVLLGVAVLIITLLIVALVRKGRAEGYDVSGTTD